MVLAGAFDLSGCGSRQEDCWLEMLTDNSEVSGANVVACLELVPSKPPEKNMKNNKKAKCVVKTKIICLAVYYFPSFVHFLRSSIYTLKRWYHVFFQISDIYMYS